MKDAKHTSCSTCQRSMIISNHKPTHCTAWGVNYNVCIVVSFLHIQKHKYNQRARQRSNTHTLYTFRTQHHVTHSLYNSSSTDAMGAGGGVGGVGCGGDSACTGHSCSFKWFTHVGLFNQKELWVQQKLNRLLVRPDCLLIYRYVLFSIPL